VILDLLLISLAITLEPVPLTAFLVVLASQRGVKRVLVAAASRRWWGSR
jgi:hypothetical protein